MLPERANPICLLMILKEYSDENHIMPMQEIILKLKQVYGLELDRRTVYSAVSLLITLGYDISTYSDNKKGYYLREREFTLPEARLIMDSLYSFTGISSKYTVDLVKKVQSVLSVHERKRYKNLVVIKSNTKTENREVFYNIELLDEAIDKKLKVAFTYMEYGFDKQLKPRRNEKYIVNPFSLVHANEHYYLICSYGDYDNISYYRVDRIKGIKLTGNNAVQAPEGFNPAEYAMKSIYMFSGEEETISIRCDHIILNDVIDKFGHDIRIVRDGSDNFIATFKAVPTGMVFWALQYLPYCEVLQPEWLREEVIASIVKNRYEIDD